MKYLQNLAQSMLAFLNGTLLYPVPFFLLQVPTKILALLVMLPLTLSLSAFIYFVVNFHTTEIDLLSFKKTGLTSLILHRTKTKESKG